MRLGPEEARRRFAAARIARLATVRPDGGPHLVPVTFVVVEETIAIAVDHKPKSTRALQRLANVAAEPRVSLLVDEYAEVWHTLWWVRADADAVVVDSLPDGYIAALQTKYPQYADHRPTGPGILAPVTAYTGWTAADP